MVHSGSGILRACFQRSTLRKIIYNATTYPDCHALLPHVAAAQTAFERAGAVVLDGGDVQDAVAALEAGCADGDGRACRVRYFWGKRDIVAAAGPALIRRACALEDAIGCMFLGNSVTAGIDPISPDDARLLISACEDGHPHTCEQLARNLPRLPFDWPAAACAQGEVVACTVSAWASLLANDTVDKAPGRSLIAQCAAGEGVACAVLAETFVDDGTAGGTVGRRVDYFERGCALGIGQACRNGAAAASALDMPERGLVLMVAGCEITGAPDLCSRAIYRSGQASGDMDWAAYLNTLILDCLSGGSSACGVAADVIADPTLDAATGSTWPLDPRSPVALRRFAEMLR